MVTVQGVSVHASSVNHGPVGRRRLDVDVRPLDGSSTQLLSSSATSGL